MIKKYNDTLKDHQRREIKLKEDLEAIYKQKLKNELDLYKPRLFELENQLIDFENKIRD